LPLAILVACAACEKERRIPYIPPELPGWERPYRGVKNLRLDALELGTLEVPGALCGIESLTERKKLTLFASVISHPREGLLIFDPGPSPAYYRKHKPKGEQRGVLAFDPATEVDLESRLRKAKLDPHKVKLVVVSSLHFYRAGGVVGLPGATLVTTVEERGAAWRGSLLGFYRPEEFERIENWRLLRMGAEGRFATFGSHVDLFGDGSVIVVPAPGYSAGGIALVVRLASRPLLLLGDFAWSGNNLRYARTPPMSADPDRWWDTAWRIKRFADLAPELAIIPGTGLGALERLAQATKDLRLHRAPGRKRSQSREKQ